MRRRGTMMMMALERKGSFRTRAYIGAFKCYIRPKRVYFTRYAVRARAAHLRMLKGTFAFYGFRKYIRYKCAGNIIVIIFGKSSVNY